MITAQNGNRNYLVNLTNGTAQISSDVTSDKGGEGLLFRPHDFLCAAYAACLNISARMVLDRLHLPYNDVQAEVDLERTEGKTIFKGKIRIDGDLTEEQKQKVIALASNCPVRKTLSSTILFEPLP